jgi:hypothetical protein
MLTGFLENTKAANSQDSALHNRETIDVGAGVDLDLENSIMISINEEVALEFSTAGRSSNQVGVVIRKIEDIFESIADSILNGRGELFIPLKVRPRQITHEHNTGGGTKGTTQRVIFPNKNTRQAWRFSKSLQGF